MRTVDVRCDRCGRRIEEGGSTLDPTSGPLHADRLTPFDLCGPCSRAFVGWLRDVETGDATDATIDGRTSEAEK